MCLGTGDPGGPRRCSGDARAALARAQSVVAVLEQRQVALEDLQSTSAPHVDVQPASSAPTGGSTAAGTAPDYHLWAEFNEGSYGCIRISPDGTRAVKEILPGPDGKPGQFGANEVALAVTMGGLGHSPRVYRALESHMEIDFFPGTPMLASYKPTEDESAMNPVQTRKLAAALRDLHLMGYVHGDMHVRQVLVDGDDVKLVDYCSAAPISERPVRALHDLNKIARLANWRSEDLADDPYIQLVNTHLTRYRDIKGVSKAAHEQRDAIAEDYLRELKELP